MTSLDWVVIALYFAGMMGVGWYYARRTRTREDYLLGGRTMRSPAVGLSMFASMLSTLTYLAVPGEMIKHGPMVAGRYIGYPLSFLVIGFLIVPFVMRMKITSAYELLEQRLGLAVRMLGSVFFLSLRLLWMSVIIYATSSKVLIPLLEWPESATPYVCAVLGCITVAYTSMGGLRAVVMTDVVQTLILFGGVGLTLALVTVKMGGIANWFPTQWAPEWDPLKVTFDPLARITIMGAMMDSFCWHVCTAGSDQMAIQRYLATPNVKSARRVVGIYLVADVCVGLFLATMGLALFAFFQRNPDMLAGREGRADQLFPLFIVNALPPGVTGMVIAGLLAAAMSSLSSGVNSASSVLAVDFIDRFRRNPRAETELQSLRRAKLLSVAVGLVIITMSIGVNRVSGNLLEVAGKMVNLLTAPLFVLFFMAFFIPWATPPGAFCAGVASAVVAIGVGHFGWFGLSFIWIMPTALLTGVTVGPLVSLLPFGRRRKPMQAAVTELPR